MLNVEHHLKFLGQVKTIEKDEYQKARITKLGVKI